VRAGRWAPVVEDFTSSGEGIRSIPAGKIVRRIERRRRERWIVAPVRGGIAARS